MYKKRAIFLKSVLPSTALWTGVTLIQCASTISESLSYCLKETVIQGTVHDEKHNRTCQPFVSVIYDTDTHEIKKPSPCACHEVVKQDNIFFFLEILFFDREKKEYSSYKEFSLKFIPSHVQWDSLELRVIGIVSLKHSNSVRANQISHFTAFSKVASKWVKFDDLHEMGVNADGEEMICTVAVFVQK